MENRREIGLNDIEVTEKRDDNFYRIKMLCKPTDIFSLGDLRENATTVDVLAGISLPLFAEDFEAAVDSELLVTVNAFQDGAHDFWYELSKNEKKAIFAKVVASEAERLRTIFKTLAPDTGESVTMEDIDTAERIADDFCMEGCGLDTDCGIEVCGDCFVRKMLDYHRAKKGEAKC